MTRSGTARAQDDVNDPLVFSEADGVRVAVENTSVAIMMIDREFKITFMNDATRDLMRENAAAFEAQFPRVDFNNMIGVSIDVFHKNPDHQRRMMALPRREPHRAEIAVGDLRFSLKISSIVDAANDYVGNVLEWANVTEVRKQSGMLDAINKAQAVIEFGLDGTIQAANQNFLATLGYDLAEIKGRHHSMFVEPAEAQRPDYQAFWEKLRSGHHDAGVYKRVGKGGKEVWIQASYNPILDTNGKAFKVVKFATDITAERLKLADYEGQIAAINKAQAVIEFGLDGVIKDANQNFLDVLG